MEAVRFLALVLALTSAACLNSQSVNPAFSSRAPVSGYSVVRSYPHDPGAFTQGLEFRDGFLYEGTGLNGRSSLRKVDLATGKVLQQTGMPQSYFGEGITVVGNRIIQLTWQSQTGFVYDRADFRMQRSFPYPGEGWGLTTDGKRIFMSDGSAQIRVWDPVTLQEEKRFQVVDGTKPVSNLNELEFVRGEIYANVWQTDFIVRISPESGKVLGWIDLTGLLSEKDRTGQVDVLNGIAYDAARNRLFVTGKLWPKLFEIRLTAKSGTH